MNDGEWDELLEGEDDKFVVEELNLVPILWRFAASFACFLEPRRFLSNVILSCLTNTPWRLLHLKYLIP